MHEVVVREVTSAVRMVTTISTMRFKVLPFPPPPPNIARPIHAVSGTNSRLFSQAIEAALTTLTTMQSSFSHELF